MDFFNKIHYGDCNKEIAKLKLMLADAQDQNCAYMRDLQELTCRLRMAILKSKDTTCADCPDKIIVENSTDDVR